MQIETTKQGKDILQTRLRVGRTNTCVSITRGVVGAIIPSFLKYKFVSRTRPNWKQHDIKIVNTHTYTHAHAHPTHTTVKKT